MARRKYLFRSFDSAGAASHGVLGDSSATGCRQVLGRPQSAACCCALQLRVLDVFRQQLNYTATAANFDFALVTLSQVRRDGEIPAGKISRWRFPQVPARRHIIGASFRASTTALEEHCWQPEPPHQIILCRTHHVPSRSAHSLSGGARAGLDSGSACCRNPVSL